MSEQDTFGTSFQLNKLEATYTVCYDNDKPIKSAYFFQIIVLKKINLFVTHGFRYKL